MLIRAKTKIRMLGRTSISAAVARNSLQEITQIQEMKGKTMRTKRLNQS